MRNFAFGLIRFCGSSGDDDAGDGRSRVVQFAAAVGIMLIASGLAGCVPGPAGYAGWAAYRQQQANEHAHLSQRNTAAARAQARSGNYSGARLLEAAAEDEAMQAEDYRDHAARDRWLSQFFH